MKRRRFFKALAAVPAAPALLAQQAAAPAKPATDASEFAQQDADVIAEPVQRYFTAPQYAALRKLSQTLMPPMKGNPGALEAGAPEFLDFLISVSPAEEQKLYTTGLDALNSRAKSKYRKSFAELDATQADAIIRPLLTPLHWAYDRPKDPVMRFLAQAHDDIRKATRNSREWNAGDPTTGRRGFGGTGLYWKPVDPIYKG